MPEARLTSNPFGDGHTTGRYLPVVVMPTPSYERPEVVVELRVPPMVSTGCCRWPRPRIPECLRPTNAWRSRHPWVPRTHRQKGLHDHYARCGEGVFGLRFNASIGRRFRAPDGWCALIPPTVLPLQLRSVQDEGEHHARYTRESAVAQGHGDTAAVTLAEPSSGYEVLLELERVKSRRWCRVG